MLSQLNQRADLLAPAQTPDGAGGFTESWNAFATVWCALAPASGNDTFGPDALESSVRAKIEIRRHSDVAAGQRVAIGTRLFAIHAVLDAGPADPLVTLDCEELPKVNS